MPRQRWAPTEFSNMPDDMRAAAKRMHDVGLYPREQEIIWYVLTGMSNAEIADRLCIAESTVKNTITRIIEKLGLYDGTPAHQRAHLMARVLGTDLWELDTIMNRTYREAAW